MTHDERIEQLLAQMTLEEKVSMCSGADRWHPPRIDRLAIPALRMTDGPHGARTETGDTPPVTTPATCFPTGSALAATWNTNLMQQVGVALADETKAKGCHILLGPAVNIQRAPLGGRNFEYYAEDPYLAGQMAVAWINGLQSQGVGASLKHFACNSSEFERMTISCEVDERALHEIHYPAFHTAVTETNPGPLCHPTTAPTASRLLTTSPCCAICSRTGEASADLSFRIGAASTIAWPRPTPAATWRYRTKATCRCRNCCGLSRAARSRKASSMTRCGVSCSSFFAPASSMVRKRLSPPTPTHLSEVLAWQKERAVLRKHLGNLMHFNWRWDTSYTINQLGRFRPERWSSELVAKIGADLQRIKV